MKSQLALFKKLLTLHSVAIQSAVWHIESKNKKAYLEDKGQFHAVQTMLNSAEFYGIPEPEGIDREFPEWPEEAPEEATVAVKDIEAVAMFLDLKAGYDVAHAQNAIADEDDYEYQKASLAFREKEQILDLPIFERVPHAIHLSLDFPTWPTTADELEYWKNRMSRIRRLELGA